MKDLKSFNWKVGKSPAFFSNQNKGFSMEFNDFRISVQWGPGNYISDKDIRFASFGDSMNFWCFGSNDAEVMIYKDGSPLFQPLILFADEMSDKEKQLLEDQGGFQDQIFNFCSAICVAQMIGCLANCPKGGDPRKELVQIFRDNQ